MLRSTLTILTAAGTIVGTATEASSTLSETFTPAACPRRLLCRNSQLRRAHPDARQLQHDLVFRHGLVFPDGVRHIRGAGTGDIGYVGVGRMRWRRCSPPHAPWTLKRAASLFCRPDELRWDTRFLDWLGMMSTAGARPTACVGMAPTFF